MFWAVMVVAALVNIFMSRYLDQINKICMIWTSAAVIIILVTLLTTADYKRDAEFVVSRILLTEYYWSNRKMPDRMLGKEYFSNQTTRYWRIVQSL